MANTIFEYNDIDGQSGLSVELYPDGSDTLANTGGDTLTEATNRKGLYTATVTEALDGLYYALIKDGATIIDNGWVDLKDDTSNYTFRKHKIGRANVTQINATAAGTSSAQLGVNVVQISGDSVAADNLEAALDGTGGVTISANLAGTVTEVTTKTGYSLASGGLNAVTAWTVNITGDFTGNLSGTVAGFSGGVLATLDDLAADLATDHGAGSWATADVSGLATTANLDAKLTAARLQVLDDWINAGRLDVILDAIQVAAERLTAARAGALDDLLNGGRLDLIFDELTTQGDTNATSLGTLLDYAAYILTGVCGTISNAGEATETYVLTIGGFTYTVEIAGLDADGTRTGQTLSKV